MTNKKSIGRKADWSLRITEECYRNGELQNSQTEHIDLEDDEIRELEEEWIKDNKIKGKKLTPIYLKKKKR